MAFAILFGGVVFVHAFGQEEGASPRNTAKKKQKGEENDNHIKHL